MANNVLCWHNLIIWRSFPCFNRVSKFIKSIRIHSYVKIYKTKFIIIINISCLLFSLLNYLRIILESRVKIQNRPVNFYMIFLLKQTIFPCKIKIRLFFNMKNLHFFKFSKCPNTYALHAIINKNQSSDLVVKGQLKQ